MFFLFITGMLAMVLPRAEKPGLAAVRITRAWYVPVGSSTARGALAFRYSPLLHPSSRRLRAASSAGPMNSRAGSIVVEVVAEASDSMWGNGFRYRFLFSLVCLRHRRTPFRSPVDFDQPVSVSQGISGLLDSCDRDFHRTAIGCAW